MFGSGVGTPANNDNLTQDLHGDQVVNYLFTDGHVELTRFDDPDLVGTTDPPGAATMLTNPGGAWTITIND